MGESGKMREWRLRRQRKKRKLVQAAEHGNQTEFKIVKHKEEAKA